MAEDQDLKIKLLRIQSKITRDNRRECFRDLFQWLTERRFKAQWPQSEEECVRVLSQEVSQQVYDIALSKGWIWQEQTRTYTVYTEYLHGSGVRDVNERNRREAHRLPTAAEIRDAWWADLILEWQARYLEMRNVQPSEGTPTGSPDQGSGQPVGRGDRVAPVAPQDSAEVSAGSHADQSRYLFRKTGEVWTLIFEGKTVLVKHTKGLTYIVQLLQNPRREFFAADLFAAAAGTSEAIGVSSAGEILDSDAIAGYRSHTKDLQDQLAEAIRNNDQGRKEALQDEIEQVTDQILAAKGFGGRSRDFSDDRERFRKSVSIAIDRSIETIREHAAALADHLDRYISKGQFLSYAGDIPWEF